MAQTTAREIVIGALVFVALLTGLFTMISYSVSDSTDLGIYNRSLNKFVELNDETEDIVNATEYAQPDEGTEGILTGMYSSSYGALQNAWSVLGIIKTMILDLSSGSLPFKIPAWFTGLIISIILVTLTFAFISSWRKWYT